eukprot:CAMPEP_0195068126 /NCGR_PEP_ID=MMETSP0448-20130528/12963_1 /TAXON_ID=66468 /ORGANISM="Heterocapsa triquestra, Strain CCMP 448" /LENGTH=126 /DNA_ID=CAMNT_0040099637 /DNA_START=58 /DNA_END=435 /DNA_ORIENTATION=-
MAMRVLPRRTHAMEWYRDPNINVDSLLPKRAPAEALAPQQSVRLGPVAATALPLDPLSSSHGVCVCGHLVEADSRFCRIGGARCPVRAPVASQGAPSAGSAERGASTLPFALPRRTGGLGVPVAAP